MLADCIRIFDFAGFYRYPHVTFTFWKNSVVTEEQRRKLSQEEKLLAENLLGIEEIIMFTMFSVAQLVVAVKNPFPEGTEARIVKAIEEAYNTHLEIKAEGTERKLIQR